MRDFAVGPVHVRPIPDVPDDGPVLRGVWVGTDLVDDRTVWEGRLYDWRVRRAVRRALRRHRRMDRIMMREAR